MKGMTHTKGVIKKRTLVKFTMWTCCESRDAPKGAIKRRTLVIFTVMNTGNIYNVGML